MQQTAIMKHWGLEPTQRTSTGEVIHTCGWLHPEGTPCPMPTITEDQVIGTLVGPGDFRWVKNLDEVSAETRDVVDSLIATYNPIQK